MSERGREGGIEGTQRESEEGGQTGREGVRQKAREGEGGKQSGRGGCSDRQKGSAVFLSSIMKCTYRKTLSLLPFLCSKTCVSVRAKRGRLIIKSALTAPAVYPVAVA